MSRGKLGLRLLMAVSVVAALVGLVEAGNWPRFRGPNGSGVADDKGIPVKWTDKDFAWKTPLPGAGNSSPVVWGDRVFLQSASTDGKERYLLCLDAGDGQVIWRKTVPGSRAKTHDKNTFASSTPATDGERVYALFWDGTAVALYAFDFKGNELWKHDVGSYTSQHGAGASPIVHDGKVILLNDHDKGAALVALDAATGKPAWAVKRDHYRACYTTPFLLERPNRKPELIVGTTTGITAYNPDRGEKLWQYDWPFDNTPLRMVASPVHGSGLIFANSGDGGGARHAVAVHPGDSQTNAKPALAWELKKGTPYVPCYLPHGEHLFWVNDGGIAGCSAAKTGEEVWSERLGGNVTASPLLIDGKVYAINESGDVYVFPAAAKFELLAKNALGEPVLATPAVANGRLFVRGGKHLFCVGNRTK
jgi:outer membrane protein assembly factor BamB